MADYIIINDNDNVMVVLKDYQQGEIVNNILLLDDIKSGHKVALIDINKESEVIKYGYPIGVALVDIKKGSFVHTHNIKTKLNDTLCYQYNKVDYPYLTLDKEYEVSIYKRENGKYGIRNQIYVVPTVGCINGIVNKNVNLFNSQYPKNSHYDGVLGITHQYGCSQMGGDLEVTKKTLQNICKNGNAGGVLILSLGCENNQLSEFVKNQDFDQKRVKSLILQELDDEDKAILETLKSLKEILDKDTRVKEPLSKVKVGLKCGGSDGLSGITANPLIGLFTNYLVSKGGVCILSEVPEMFGAETILMKRAKDKKVFDDIVSLINNFKTYYSNHNVVIYENPSPGNKAGGITTLEEKSLGCIQKGGLVEISGCYEMGDLVDSKGLNLIETPGNDLISSTILGASGANLILFSTGRGTPYGSFVPTIKISTNESLAKRKSNWIDFDASIMLRLNKEEVLTKFIDLVISIINGEEALNETNSCNDIGLFKDGVSL
jgi:altronate hydrolase